MVKTPFIVGQRVKCIYPTLLSVNQNNGLTADKNYLISDIDKYGQLIIVDDSGTANPHPAWRFEAV